MKSNDFADLIERNLENLVEDWAEAVRADGTIISADDLSEGGLRDHIPQILEEICEVVRSGKPPKIQNTREGRINAYTRFKQNYRAQDLAAEVSLLRLTLLDCLSESVLNPGLNLKLNDYLAATRQIHLYIDEELRYAFSIFSESSAKDACRDEL
jgi:hypothetical protein